MMRCQHRHYATILCTKINITMDYWWPFCLAVLCLFLPRTCRAQNCSNETCIMSFNRTCGIANDECTGPCIANHTDFGGYRDACFAINEIDWEAFIQRFDPTFKADDLTKEERLQLLIRIARFINEYNLNNPNVQLAINKYSADSEEDLRAKTGYRYVEDTDSLFEPQLLVSPTSSGLPSKRDWVEEGAVTSVKDQGRCGCCWGIANAGAIEGAAAINSNFTYLQSVSFQQFISCDDSNAGCDGGDIITAMFYAVKLNERDGMARLNDYPYTDELGEATDECNLEPSRAVEANSGTIVVTFDEPTSFEARLEKMKYAVSRQPVAMLIKSICNLFNNYRSGIVTDDEECRCEDVDCIDHAVLLVGYNDEADIPYWKIKNSWGTGWGEDGYIRVAQESGDRQWGLFGMLAQGVVALNVNNVTGQVYDVPQTTNLTKWQIALVAVAGFLVALCCCCGIMALTKRK